MFTILFSKGVFVFCVLVVIVLILLAYAIKTANALKAAENKVRELDSDVDIALAKRYDLLTKQYAMVKTYMSYESENLITAIKLRKGMTPDEKTGVEKLMKKCLGSDKCSCGGVSGIGGGQEYRGPSEQLHKCGGAHPGGKKTVQCRCDKL